MKVKKKLKKSSVQSTKEYKEEKKRKKTNLKDSLLAVEAEGNYIMNFFDKIEEILIFHDKMFEKTLINFFEPKYDLKKIQMHFLILILTKLRKEIQYL